MPESSHPWSRREAVIYLVCLLPAWPAQASKAAKADFAYQSHPKQGKSCATCRLFSTNNGIGNCAIVEGDVSPDGWCMAYSPRDA